MRAKGYVEAKIEDVKEKESQLRFKKPTTEEMRLAQLLDDKQQDVEREHIISQVMETTSRLRDDVIIALHDCNYDPIRAIEILMDHDDLAKEEWQECGIAKRKKKVAAVDEIHVENAEDGFQNAGEHPHNNLSQRSGNRRPRNDKSGAEYDNAKPTRGRPNRGRGDDRRSRTVGERHPLSGSNNENASDAWQQNESEGNQNHKPYRKFHEPGADEPAHEGGPPRRGRGGASARGRSWYGGRNGGAGGNSGPPNGVGRGRHNDRQTGASAQSENANSFTVGTWENSADNVKPGTGKQVEEWDMDEWDGSLTQTQVFERSNAGHSEKVSYGAIGARPSGNHDNGASPSHSPSAGPIRVTLDNVMKVARPNDPNEGGNAKSPRRPEQGEQRGKPTTPQRQEKNAVSPAQQQAQQQQQRSQQNHHQQPQQHGKAAHEPPVVILDNRGHAHGNHSHTTAAGGTAGLGNIRFGSGLDSIGLPAVGGTNGSLDANSANLDSMHHRQQTGAPNASSSSNAAPSSVTSTSAASRQLPPASGSSMHFPSSPYQRAPGDQQQTSPTKQAAQDNAALDNQKFRQQPGHGAPGNQQQLASVGQGATGISRPQGQSQQPVQGFGSHTQESSASSYPGSQGSGASAANSFQQQQQHGSQQQSYRPPSATSKTVTAHVAPAGLDPTISARSQSGQSAFQQQQHQQAGGVNKLHQSNGSADQSSSSSPYGVQSHHQQQQQQQIGALGRQSQQQAQQQQQSSAQSQQQQSANAQANTSIPSLLLQHQSAAPVYTGSSAYSAPGSTSTKLTESMTKLSVQDVVKSPQRSTGQQSQGQGNSQVSNVVASQQQQQPSASQQQQQQQQQQQNAATAQQQQQQPTPVTSAGVGQQNAAGFDQNMLKFVPPPYMTPPYYFPQYPSNSNQQQQPNQQPQTSVAANDYFNSPDVANLYQRTLLEQQQLLQQQQQQQAHGQQQQGHQQQQQQGNAASPMMKPSQDRLAAEQLLNLPSHVAAQSGANSLPPHSSAAGMPPGGVPPAFLPPQLFYPLMQLFAANPTLMAPFLASQVPAQLAASGPAGPDLKSQAQFLQAVGMSPYLHYPQQQQQAPGSSHPGDDAAVTSGQHSSQQSLVGQQAQQAHLGNNDSIVVGQQAQVQQQHQSHQQHVSQQQQQQQQSIRPPPGFLMPVRQSSSAMNMPANNSDGNLSGFRAFQQHQGQQGEKQSSAGGPPGLFGAGPTGAQQAFLATGGAQQRQGQQAGGVIKQQQQNHMPYWNPNS